MARHVLVHALGAAQETRVPQLVDLVGANCTLAEVPDQPVQVGRRGPEEADTRAPKVIFEVVPKTSGRSGFPAASLAARMFSISYRSPVRWCTA